MDIIMHEIRNAKIAEIIADELVIRTPDDALNLLGNLYYQGYDKIILHGKNIIPDFFDLKTGLAGEILQKFSQYRMPLVIVDDFSMYKSRSLKDFIYESNKGKHINFLGSTDDALMND
ncbi:MAG: DUF4180 domain-containing protein [Proteiniphilum sp.]|nr:DUF4180 domain-containing protein [Proteiniphilum sp.]